jgi:glyoxylase-like metal-dependent hydrolase (beta-lactamase superfamily II)
MYYAAITVRAGRLACIVSLAVAPLVAGAQDAGALLRRSAGAMGATDLKSIRYVAEGIGYSYGQAFKPGLPWPKINVHGHIRTIHYDSAAMRDEIVLSRAEPQGGGGYPLSGPQRNDQYLSGAHAWNQTGPAPTPGPRFVGDRTHQLWITPHGVVKAATRLGATLQWRSVGGKSLAAVSLVEPGRYAATAFINDEYLVERVESRVPDTVLGETQYVTEYVDYRDFDGVKFPTRIRQAAGGHPVLDVAVKEVQPNAPAAFEVPELVRTATERVAAEKIADGVWFIAGGSHHSVAIEMKDHMVLVEAPLNEARTLPVIEHTRQLVPGKPVSHVINTHTHFDHSGGLRTAAAEGATIITHADNVPYFQRAFTQHSKIRPDRLASSGKRTKFTAVKDKLVLDDGTRTIEIHHVAGGPHTTTFLMVYLPKEKLLIEADAYTPAAPNAPPPATPDVNNLNLIENIERLKLVIDRIAPIHGRVVLLSELYGAVGKAAPRP